MTKIEEAIAALKQGKLIGLPTETVYGLAAPASRADLIEKIFTLKERPFYDPLILHVSDVNMAKKYVKDWPAVADALCDALWPGPLTLILEKRDCVGDMITAGLSSVGVRCPDSQIARELFEIAEDAFAAPSANKFTKTSPSCAEHVRESFLEEDVFVLDGGLCKVGIESTIVSLLKLESENVIELLRPGMITIENIKEVIPHDIEVVVAKNAFEESAARISPGLEKVHYCPEFPCGVVSSSNRNSIENRECYDWIDLNPSPVVTAREVYSLLRSKLSPELKGRYFVVPSLKELGTKENDMWQSILDRLLKASSLPCKIA